LANVYTYVQWLVYSFCENGQTMVHYHSREIIFVMKPKIFAQVSDKGKTVLVFILSHYDLGFRRQESTSGLGLFLECSTTYKKKCLLLPRCTMDTSTTEMCY
jgi:hypothetical protein